VANSEDEMDKPVTKRELHEALSTWGGALEAKLEAKLDKLEARLEAKLDQKPDRSELDRFVHKTDLDRFVHKTDLDRFVQKTDLPGIENRIAAAVVSAVEIKLLSAIDVVLKDYLEPRFKRIEDKVFAPKRRRS
jgi:hypothetical protein